MVQRVFAICVSILLLIPLSVLADCGVERWSVKTGTDPDAVLINLLLSTASTVSVMRSWPTPSPIPSNSRVSPYEINVWNLTATLRDYKAEGDSDYHLVLVDSSGNTMIAEIPSLACVGAQSPFLPGIQNARTQFDSKYTATTSFKTADIPVQIKGVGMFDFLHGQRGVAPNGIELHPVLEILFTAQILMNPGFEDGPISWIASSSKIIDSTNSQPAHSGNWKAWLNGYGKNRTDTLYQQVTIPSGVTSAKLSFWLRISTAETGTTKAADTLKLKIRNDQGVDLKTLATYSNLNAAGGYVEKTFDLSAYKGQTIQVYLLGSENRSKQTSFFVDDLALTTQ